MHDPSPRRIRPARVGMLAAVAAAGSLAVIGAGQASAQGTAQPGAVFSMTNNATGNSITAYDRAAGGSLANPRSFATGGQGTGTPEDPPTA